MKNFVVIGKNNSFLSLTFIISFRFSTFSQNSVPISQTILREMGTLSYLLWILLSLLLLANLCKALAAINRPVRLWLERHLRLTPAPGTGCGKILPRTTSRCLTRVSAGFATLRLILESPLRVEFLFTGSKHELLATFLTYKRLVFVHDFPLLESSFRLEHTSPTPKLL